MQTLRIMVFVVGALGAPLLGEWNPPVVLEFFGLERPDDRDTQDWIDGRDQWQ